MEYVGGARALVLNSIPLLLYDESTMDPDESERTERKRKRERDRRSELSRAFDDLGAVLNDLDPTPAQGAQGSAVQSLGGGGGKKGKKDIDLTRLDKLHQATALLRRMHRDMVGMQRQIASYEQRQPQRPTDKDDGDKEVIVMVPTLTLQPDLSPGHPASVTAASSRYQAEAPIIMNHPPPSMYELSQYSNYPHASAAISSSLAATSIDPYALLPTNSVPQQYSHHDSSYSPSSYRSTYQWPQHDDHQQQHPPQPPHLPHQRSAQTSYPYGSSSAFGDVAGGYSHSEPPPHSPRCGRGEEGGVRHSSSQRSKTSSPPVDRTHHDD